VSSGIVKRLVLLGLTAVSLYLLAPALLDVFGSFPRLVDLSPLWFALMLVVEAGAYACMWSIQRLALRTREWVPVITSQLAAGAFGAIIPGGLAAAGALQYQMLVRGGVPPARAASGMAAASILVFGSLLALPVLTLPAILGGAPVERGLELSALAGAVLFMLLVLGGLLSFGFDRPLLALGHGIEAVRNRLMRRKEPLTGVPERLLRERDMVRHTLGQRWWQAMLFASGRWLLDYLTLLAALTAVGANPRPSLVLLAYCAAQALGTLPLTPGGLGFVEAGLTGTLALAGVPAGQAVVATLAYRLVSFWLPIPAGGVAALIHRRRYGAVEPEPAAAGGISGGG
jgi:uncharacterized membrane protein YbhN (UPF0104 family)